MNTFTDLQEKGIEVGHKFNLLEIALFELYLMLGGFLLAKLFPQILSLNFVVWYTLIFGFGMGYFIAKIFGKIQ